MSQRRTLILVAAIVLAVVAGFLVWNYVDGVEERAMGDAKLVSVYVVKQTIPRGTSAEQARAQIVQEQIPQKFRPDNSVTNLADISGQVAVTDLPTNQVLVRDQWVEASDPSAMRSFTEKLRQINGEDMTALTVQLDTVRTVGGVIVPGDYVNIMARPPAVNWEDDSGGEFIYVPRGEPQEALSYVQLPARYVYLKAEVLAVGSATTPTAGAADPADETTAGSDPTLITFILPTDAAQYVASLDSSWIYLSLVSPDYTIEVQSTLDLTVPLPAETSGMLTPYGPDGADAGQ